MRTTYAEPTDEFFPLGFSIAGVEAVTAMWERPLGGYLDADLASRSRVEEF